MTRPTCRCCSGPVDEHDGDHPSHDRHRALGTSDAVSRAAASRADRTWVVAPGSLCPGHAAGPVDQLSIEEVLAAMPNIPAWRTLDRATTRGRRLRGAARVLGWLETRPATAGSSGGSPPAPTTGWGGSTSSPADDAVTRAQPRRAARRVNCLLLGRVIRPGYEFFSHYKTYTVFATAPLVISPDGVRTVVAQRGAASTIVPEAARSGAGHADQDRPAHRSASTQLTAEEFDELRDVERIRRGHSPEGLTRPGTCCAAAGILLRSSYRGTRRDGQLPTAVLVDRYRIALPHRCAMS